MLFSCYLIAAVSAQAILNSYSKRSFKRDEYGNGTLLIDLTHECGFYTLPMEIGSEKEQVTFGINTASSDLWVTSQSNPFCDANTKRDEGDSKLDCTVYGTYDSDNSTSFSSNDTEFFVQYNDYTYAQGNFAQDDFIISGINLDNVDFVLVNATNHSISVLGLGLENNEATNYDTTNTPFTYANFPAQLVNQGVIFKNSYSLALDDENDEGILLFGGVDHAKYNGTLTLVPFISIDADTDIIREIQITVSDLKISNSSLLDDLSYVLLDSGSQFSLFPSDVFDELVDMLNLTESDGDYYSTSCNYDSSVSLVFDLQGFELELPVSTFFCESGDSCDCSGEIDADLGCKLTVSSNSDGFIFGDDILSSLYVVFDLQDYKAGIALANHSDEEDVEAIISDIPNATSAASYSASYTPTASSTDSSASSTASSSSDSSSKSGAVSLKVDSHLKTLLTVLTVVVLFL